MTNARFATLHGLPVGPIPLSTTPVPLRSKRARHERTVWPQSRRLPSGACHRRFATQLTHFVRCSDYAFIGQAPDRSRAIPVRFLSAIADNFPEHQPRHCLGLLDFYQPEDTVAWHSSDPNRERMMRS